MCPRLKSELNFTRVVTVVPTFLVSMPLIVWVLPGEFSNTVRMLVPDVNAPVMSVSARDLTSLKRHWPSSLFADMNKRQVEHGVTAV